jgi:hypothetical protein
VVLPANMGPTITCTSPEARPGPSLLRLIEIEDLKEAMEEVVRETKLGLLRNVNRGNLEGLKEWLVGWGRWVWRKLIIEINRRVCKV